MKLGVPPEKYESRDAVHVAYIVAHAGETIAPGAKVRFYIENKYPFLYDDDCELEMAYVELEMAYVRNADPDCREDWDGVLDPFLAAPVEAESWCRVLMNPNAISGMRHSFDISTRPDETHCRLCN